jgi:glycosyltransferase involved in cell wall biosynthesis
LPEYKAHLEHTARERKIFDRVKILGAVSDELLHAYLHHADLCLTLRYPVTEGASASAIEEMLFGKPVIVNEIGFYAELPNECVVKVPCGDAAALAAALKGLMENESRRNSVGSAAQIFAKREFRADRYAREIMDFGWEVSSAQHLLNLADRVAVQLSRMSITAEMPVVDRIAATCEDLFSARRPRRSGN